MKRSAKFFGALVLLAIAPQLGCGSAGGSTTQANGTIGAWRASSADATLPPLPVPRANHCSVAAQGRLYVFGGNYKPAASSSFVAIGDVIVADQGPSGALTAWRNAGALPSAVTGCTAASDGDRVFLVGGLFEDEAQRGRVWAANIQADGSLAAFTDLGRLPPGDTIVSSQAFVRDQTLFVFDSTLSGGDPSKPEGIVLLHAPLGAAVPLGDFTIDRGPPGFRGRPQYAVAHERVFVLGGYLSGDLGNEVVADGFGAPLGATGMGTSSPVSSLPAPRAFGSGVGVDDWVFVLGGKTAIFDGAGRPDVYAAQVAADGTLGPFMTLATMPEGRTNLDAAVLGDYLYVTGGGSTGGGLDNVYAAQVKF